MRLGEKNGPILDAGQRRDRKIGSPLAQVRCLKQTTQSGGVGRNFPMSGARPDSFSPFHTAEDPSMRGGLPALPAWSAVSAAGRASPTVYCGGRAGTRRLPSWPPTRDGREAGQLVQVGVDAGQHLEHAGRSNETYSVSESVSGRGLTTTISPRSSRFSHSRHRRKASNSPARWPEGRHGPGWGRLLTWVAGVISPPLLAEPPGDLAGLVRAEGLVDPAWAQPGRGRDVTDRQDRLMGFDEAPDPFPLGFFEPSRAMLAV